VSKKQRLLGDCVWCNWHYYWRLSGDGLVEETDKIFSQDSMSHHWSCQFPWQTQLLTDICFQVYLQLMLQWYKFPSQLSMTWKKTIQNKPLKHITPLPIIWCVIQLHSAIVLTYCDQNVDNYS
jgi:predicted nucleic acid binding AN1-type Zn finger protein